MGDKDRQVGMNHIVQNLKFQRSRVQKGHMKCAAGRLTWEDVWEGVQLASDLRVRGSEDCWNFQI